MLTFSNEYFEPEVRDGFYVSSIMKKCWAAQLEVLSDVAKVCKRYNIKWYADCGTLLGAVRHGGFIPWDDDLDICMFRDDYYKFLSVASRELTNIWPHYKILNYHNESYWEPISRIVNADDINFSVDRIEKFHGYPFAAGIDIFPLDFVCPDKEEEENRKLLFKTIFELADSEYADTIDLETLTMLAESIGKKVDNNKSQKLQLYEWGEIVSSMYRREEAKDVCLMTFWYRYNNHIYPMSLFEETVDIPFENINIQAPAGCDEVLKIEYGDYMKLVRTGGVHEYPHFEWQLQKVEEWLGESSPFHRSIDKNTKITTADERTLNLRKSVKERAIKMLRLIAQVHKEIHCKLEKDQSEELIELLSQCQEAAIQIGTYIEDYYGEGFVTVKYFEEYCEYVYELAQSLENSKEAAKNKLICLNEQLEVIEDSINNDIKVLREVVFLPYKADCWHILDGLWKGMQDDSEIHVSVVPIPYYYKKATGEIYAENFDVESYPDYLPLTDYKTFDFEKLHPDQIIIQYPYDNDDFVTTIDSRFYVNNLKSYTDELVYVPYFKTEEIGQGEERAYKVMDDYVLTPGVVYSDKVILQSKAIKELYIKKLIGYFGEDTKGLWEEKLSGDGGYLYNKRRTISKDLVDIPDEWRKILLDKDGNYKKIIIYNLSISSLFKYKELMIDKMKSVFVTFMKNSGKIAMIMHPDPLIEATIPKYSPELYEDYLKIVNEYIERGYGIYDDSGDVDRLLNLADAYYGDTDKLVQECRNRKIPVMIQNVEVI